MKPNQLYERREALQIVDVREPEEWRSGRIQEARHMPMGDLPQRWARSIENGPWPWCVGRAIAAARWRSSSANGASGPRT